MKHIGTKLFLGFICMAVLTIGILWIIQAGFMRENYQNERINSVRHAVSDFTRSGATDYDVMAEQLNVNLLVFDKGGNLIYRTPGLPMMGMMIHTVQSMIASGINDEPRLISVMPGTARYALLGQPTEDGYLFAVFSLADLDAASHLLRQQLWMITLVLIVLSMLLAVFLSVTLARPVRAVTRAARQLAAGNLDVRLPVRSQDEVGQLTQALNDLGIELGRTEKLRRELIANVSHELRSPLTVIQGYAETVRDVTWPDEEKRISQLNMIINECSRLTRIVKDILDYSRMQAGDEKLNLSEFSICPVFEHLEKQYEIEASRHQVRIQASCPDQTVVFDRERLDQVLYNLMNNAISHAWPETVIEVRAILQDGISRIEVRNTGEPILPDDLPRIWDRYYRAGRNTDKRTLGTGLGLAIVKSIFERHQVRYGVLSENEHTIFWFETCRSIV